MRRLSALVLLMLALVGGAQAAVRKPRGLVVMGYPLSGRCPAAGIADAVDRWEMNACNCTSYVAWALDANGQRVDWFVPGAMDAWNWPNVARRAGLVVSSTPKVGSAVVWARLSRPFGHVAYVTRVHAGGTFDVSEYNLGPRFGHRPYTYDARRDVSPQGAVFIYVPRR